MGGRSPRARARVSGKLIVWQSLLPGKGGYTMKNNKPQSTTSGTLPTEWQRESARSTWRHGPYGGTTERRLFYLINETHKAYRLKAG